RSGPYPPMRSWSSRARPAISCSRGEIPSIEGGPPMFVAKVTGSLVATQKVASMTGHKLLTVEPYRVDDKARDRLVPTGRTFVVRTVGAGVGAFVLACRAPGARLPPETEKLPVDAVVIGLVDTVDVEGKVIFSSRDPGRSSG